jgi:hypothetical protein
MRSLRVLVIAVAGLAVFSCSSAVVAGAGWQRLGERTVNGRRDIDTIKVGAKKGEFRRIRFDVSGSAMDMHNIVVHFANGEKFSPETRYTFGKGENSRSIDLPGGGRKIEKVVFKYSNLRGGGRAQVTLFGEH